MYNGDWEGAVFELCIELCYFTVSGWSHHNKNNYCKPAVLSQKDAAPSSLPVLPATVMRTMFAVARWEESGQQRFVLLIPYEEL